MIKYPHKYTLTIFLIFISLKYLSNSNQLCIGHVGQQSIAIFWVILKLLFHKLQKSFDGLFAIRVPSKFFVNTETSENQKRLYRANKR